MGVYTYRTAVHLSPDITENPVQNQGTNGWMIHWFTNKNPSGLQALDVLQAAMAALLPMTFWRREACQGLHGWHPTFELLLYLDVPYGENYKMYLTCSECSSSLTLPVVPWWEVDVSKHWCTEKYGEIRPTSVMATRSVAANVQVPTMALVTVL